MQKLVCFGDSYIANDLPPTGMKPLGHIIADNLGVPLLNFGRSGSGLRYSIDKFYRYLVSSDYHTNDYIFFNTSLPHRLWLPQSGDDFFIFPDSVAKEKETSGNRFFKKNAREINWAIGNLVTELEHDILHIVRTMAYQALRGNRCVVVNAFRMSELCFQICQTASSSKRFRNLVFQEGMIASSVAEFDDYELVEWDNEAKYNRHNHYSQMNLNKLGEQFTLEFQGTSAFDPSQLKRGFIKAKR